MEFAETGDSVWQTGPARLEVGEDEVHVWRAPFGMSDALRERLSRALEPEEWTRAERYASPVARDQYLLTRGILRDILARYLPTAPGELRFRRAERGKPELEEPPGTGLEFNLSDSGTWVLCAVARGRRVGIDIERIEPRRPLRRLARRFLAAGEVAALERVGDSELPVAFYSVWTRKEAYLKATGEGLVFPLSRFDVTAPESLEGWQFSDVFVGEGYRAALVVESGGRRIRCWEWAERP